MMRIATILTALLLSACNATSPKVENTEEIVYKEGLFLSFTNHDGKVIKQIATGQEEVNRNRVYFDDEYAKYEVMVVYNLNSCKHIEHLSYYKECTNPEQKILLARGAITQYLKKGDQTQPKVDDFRILKVLNHNTDTQSPSFKTQFQEYNLDVSWTYVNKQN